MNAVYLQVPIYFAYKMKLGSFNNRLGVAGGPYLAYGMAGKMKSDGNRKDTFDGTSFWKKGDIGFGSEVNFELKDRIVFALGSEYGLLNIWKRGTLESRGNKSVYVRNVGIYLSVGYVL